MRAYWGAAQVRGPEAEEGVVGGGGGEGGGAIPAPKEQYARGPESHERMGRNFHSPLSHVSSINMANQFASSICGEQPQPEI